jgi:lysophospholipase L1-like esterase
MLPSCNALVLAVAISLAWMLSSSPDESRAWGASTSTSKSPASVKPAQAAAKPVARIAAAGDSPTIAFDEYSLGASITDDYAAEGIVFTSDVFLSNDDSNPTAPVLSGTPKFFGDIVGHFTVPGTATPTTVNGFTFDVGYIDDRNSVEIEYYDAAGNIVGATRAQSFGINTIDVAYRGVAGFKVSAVEYEAAGFAIDNLVVRRGVAGIRPARMAAFGDSYSSGEGLTPEKGLRYDCGTDLHENRYYENTNVRRGWPWIDGQSCDTRTGFSKEPERYRRRSIAKYENLCHRHGRAYPNQIRARLGVQGPSSIFSACSAATTANVGLLSFAESQYIDSPFGVHGGYVQLVDVATFARAGDPDLITIGIGGNDAKFGEIVRECIFHACLDPDFSSRTISTINGTMFRNVRDTFVKLRARFPAATVVTFGYPSVIDDPAKGCAGVTGIGEDERSWLKHSVLPAVNDSVKDAATEAGVVYVDITRATAGHGICADDEWINGLRGGNDVFGIVGNESFHPNQKAHDAIANLFVDRYTDGAGALLVVNPEPSGPIRPATGPEIRLGRLDAGAGRACGADCLQPAACVQACVLHVQGDGFTPGVSMQAVLQSDPVVLGPVVADAAGSVNAKFPLPRGVAAGDHSLTLDGMAADGTRQRAVAGVRVYRRVSSRIVAKLKTSRRGAKVRKLTVRRLPARSRVRIACGRGALAVSATLAGGRESRRVRRARRRAGCKFAKRSFRIQKRTARRSFAKYFKRRLKSGVVLRIVVTQPGVSGRALDVRVRKGKRPRISRGCVEPGQAMPVRC